jgi:hypothetical protein
MKLQMTVTNLLKKILFFAALFLVLSSCKKKTETVETLTVEELYPLSIGKYITYRLDSLVFTNAGKQQEIHRYRVKHVVEQQVKDNLNRPAWRVTTYITDSLGITPWVPNGTYIVTPLDKQVEVTENNLRVIRLRLPAKEGFLWKGNTYLPDRPYNPEYPLVIDINMGVWDFEYQSINQTEKINNKDVNDVTTVFHIDESENVPVVRDTVFASRELSFEKYAKNIGLVYKEFQLWENQPRPRQTGIPPNVIITYDPVRIGFGVKMWMIDRN